MNKYLKAFSANILFFILNILFFLIITPLSVRIMGDKFYGIWTVLYSLVLFSNIGTLGISIIVNKFVSELGDIQPGDDQVNHILGSSAVIICGMGVLVAAAFITCRYWLASLLLVDQVEQEVFTNSIIVISLSFFPQYLCKVPQGFFLSQYKNSYVRLIEFMYSCCLWIGALLSVSIFGKNLLFISFLCLFLSITLLIVYWIPLVKKWKVYLRIRLAVIRRIFGFSKYLFVESLAYSAYQQLDKVIVGVILGPAFAGVYGIGTSLSQRISLFVFQIADIIMPYASYQSNHQENQILFETLRKITKLISLVVAVIASLLILFMKEILSIWISPSFAINNSRYFCVLIIAYALFSLSRPAHQVLTGAGKVKFTSLLFLVCSMLMLTLVFFLSRQFTFWGAISANFSIAVLFVYNLYCYRFLLKKSATLLVVEDLLPGVVIPVLSFVFISLVPSTPLKFLISVMILCFVGYCFFRDHYFRSIGEQYFRNFIHLIVSNRKVD